MTDLDRAIDAAHKWRAVAASYTMDGMTDGEIALVNLLAALDAAQGEAVAWYRPSEEGYDSAFRDAATVARCDGHDWAGWVPLYLAPQAPPAAVVPAEPVAWVWQGYIDALKAGNRFEKALLWNRPTGQAGFALYAAPPAAVPDWLPQPDEVEYVGDAGPATDADFSVTEAQAELRLLRGNVRAVCGAVEAMRTAGGRVEFQAAFDAAKVLAAALAVPAPKPSECAIYPVPDGVTAVSITVGGSGGGGSDGKTQQPAARKEEP